MPNALLGKTTKVLSALSPFIVLVGIVLLQSQEYKKSVQNLNHADYLAQEQEQKKSLNWQQQTVHLGFDNLQADWLYLDFVQYFGDTKARENIGYKLVPEYFETITRIDPRFTTAYLNLALANSMYAGYPEKSIALMEEVLGSVDPASEKAAYLWTSKGLDELLFMGDKQAAIKSYQMAAQWQSLANAKKPNDLTIKDLESALQDTNEIELKQAQIRAWSTVLAYVRDQPRQREILAKIAHFQTEIAALEQNKVNHPKVIK
jgi:tetratricopeptide (TPR) repeat protein